MSRYTVDHDRDFDIYYVVKWSDPLHMIGTIVYTAYTQAVADEWIVTTVQEENLEIFNEFG